MNLSGIESLDIEGKKVLLRLDLDVPIKDGQINANRLEAGLPSIKLLQEKGAKSIVILGKRGRPKNREEEMSNRHLLPWFKEKLGEVNFLEDFEEVKEEITLFENLRFWKEEKENNEEFAGKLAKLGGVFVNDSFAVSHREHASIVGIPKHLPSAFGNHFLKEVENLSRVFNDPKRPVIVTLSGVKEDKLKYLDSFLAKADKILVAGRLGDYLDEDYKNEKLVLARLMPDKEDITINSIEKFEEEVEKAKTILISGPMGKFEEEGHMQGTKRVFTKISETNAFKVAGGGDTENALEMLGLREKFDWVSTGGGAMLEFLANGTLPGIEAVG